MSTASAPEPSFESRLAELAEITAALEQGSLGLDESLAKFERGVGLLRQCREMLETVERKVEILTGFDADGQPVTRPFEADATFEGPGAARQGSRAAEGRGSGAAGTSDDAKPARKRAPRKGTADGAAESGDSPNGDDKSAGPSLF
jgi:exodeoxyribonuclease VII small subunit